MPDDSPSTFMSVNNKIKNSAPTAEMFITRGLIYFNRGDFYNAKADFDSAVILKPDSAEALYDYALALEKIDSNDEAIEIYDRLIATDSEFFNGRYNRGRLKVLKGDYNRALEDFNRALEIDPNSADVINEIGVVHFRQQKYEEAYADLNRAAELDARNETVAANRKVLDSCIKKKK